MPTEPLIRTSPSQARAAVSASPAPQRRPVRVFMMDLLSIVPYYTGHLSSALGSRQDISLRVGSITYHLDPGYFTREKLRLAPGSNLASKLPSRPAGLRRTLKLFEYLFNLWLLVVRFALRKPDVLHVQFLPLLGRGLAVELWAVRAIQRMGIQVVYTVHNLLPHDTGDRYRALFRRMYAVPDALICHDQTVRNRLVSEFGVSPSRITVIPHGPLFTPSGKLLPESARRRLAIPADQPLVLWQGILRSYKGVSFLLKAWQRVAAHHPRALLAIVGTGEDALTSAIASEVEELGIASSVRLDLRFLTAEEVALFYTAADVIVYPYSQITTSGALMTGLAYGKAVVTTRLEAFQSVLTHGKDALMVPYNNVEALSGTLLGLLEQPALRGELGAAARKTYLQAQAWPEIAANTAAVYQRLVNA